MSDLVNDKDKDLEIRGEAALILSLCGYTNSRLTEQLKKIISKVAEDSLGKEVSRPIVTSDLSGHCFVITTSSGIDKVTYPKSFIILVAALYNIYENCNRSDLMRNLLTQYKLTRLKGEIQDLIETFMPLKLEGYAKKHLKPINK